MKIIGTVISLFFLVLLAYVVWTVYSSYRKQTGTTLERLLAACRDSMTILVNKFFVVVAAILAQLDAITTFFNMPELKAFIDQWFTPKTVALVMLAMASLTIWARMRPGSNNPLPPSS